MFEIDYIIDLFFKEMYFFLMTCSLIYVLSFTEAEIIYLYLNYICMILSEAKKLII